MYESENWEVDRSRRQAIEMLASWPIMSLGIRPFLELASFFPIKKTELFLLEVDTLPCLPLNSRELLQLFAKEERSESINHQLDYFALETLTDVATWAANQITPINESELLDEQKEMIVTRLTALTALREFKAQFSFRVHGGYSNRKPDLTYQQEHPESERFEENPTKSVYKNALVLRLRFSGWGLVQLATDPDPPSDEVGCTGIIMLQPSDGKKRRLNRALVWQRHINDLTEIVRGPSDVLPKIGVNCVDISLMVAGEDMKASCVPLHAPISPSAVDTSAVDKTLDITGLTELCRFKPADVTGDERRKVRIDLLEKAGFKPLLLGENHLIWQEGEPVDPFILAVLVDTSANEQEPDLAFSREIYNEGKRLIEMTPYERTLSARGPLGFEDKVTNVPTWAKQNFSKEEASFIGKPGYPTNYCIKRTQHLEQALRSVFMDADINLLKSEDVNTIVSLIDRMECITQNPKGRFTQWMTLLLHYAHTISGPLRSNDTNAILETVRKKTGISCTIRAVDDRNETNARWLIKFCQGIMDVDALSDFVFGELYIPLTIIANQDQQVRLTHSWTFNKPMYHPLSNFALDFEHAFWRDDYIYGLVPNSRTLKIDDTQELIEKVSETIGYHT